MAIAVRITIAVAALSCALSMLGCSREESVVGTWELDTAAFQASIDELIEERLDAGGLPDGAAEAGSAMEESVRRNLEAQFEGFALSMSVNADGTFSFAQARRGQTESGSGTWAETATGYAFEADGEARPVTLSDSALRFDAPGVPFELVLRRK